MSNSLQRKRQAALNDRGQGLTEYTVIVLLVALVFWIGVRDTDIGENLQTAWKEVSVSFSPTGGSGEPSGSMGGSTGSTSGGFGTTGGGDFGRS